MTRFRFLISIILAKAGRPGVLLLVILFSLASNLSGATTGRIQALGGNGAFFEDEANILRWYGSLGDYPSQAVLEAGHFNLPWGYHNETGEILSGPGLGVHRFFGNEGNLGTAALYFHGRSPDTDPGSLVRSPLKNTVTALFCRPLGVVSTTLVFRRATSATTHTLAGIQIDDPVALDVDHSRTEFGGGVRLDLSASAYLDLAGEFRHSIIREAQTTLAGLLSDNERCSTGSFNLRSRAFLQLGPKAALVPVTEIIVSDEPLPFRLGANTESMAGHLVRIGCGLNYYPDTDKLLLLSLDYLNGRNEFTNIMSDANRLTWARDWNSFTLGLGAETRFLSWLTFRGSFSYEHLSRSEAWLNEVIFSGQLHEMDQDSDTLRAYLGAGLHVGSFDLDLALSENFPRTPAGYLGHELFPDDNNWLTATLRREF
ncbi:MAG: hypothetical protein KOO60_04110 [Gemmatimonadales bacterium]|nr:hypothetical protein [Gemmatimonadales bacterium]